MNDEGKDHFGDPESGENSGEKTPLVRKNDGAAVVTLPRSDLELLLKRQADLERRQEEMEALLQKREENWQAPSPSPPVLEEAPTVEEEAQERPKFWTGKTLSMFLGGNLFSTEEEDPEYHVPFGESIYTVLYFSEAWSQSFIYGVFILCLQLLTILLTLVGILDLDAPTNRIAIPAMVDPIVTVTQAVALLLALAFQSDLIEAVLKIQDGWNPELLKEHPGATFATWLFSCIAQLVAGLLLLSTIFILTMQVQDVLSIMLNFAALHFMADIDDYGFALAKMGFIRNAIQREVLAYENIQIPKRKSRNRGRRVLYCLTMIGIFAGYGILKKEQIDGDFLPNYVYVQFGDAYNPKIPYFSGILKTEYTRTASQRRYRDLGTENILLGYCHSEGVWAFSEVGDPCNYFAMSYKTTTYDVTSIHDSEWQVLDDNKRPRPFDSFSLVSRDCDPSTCNGECDGNGYCRCEHDQFGMDCEFSDICEELTLDERFDPFPPIEITSSGGKSGISDSFHLLRNSRTKKLVKVYNMPVYYSNKTFPGNIIFFGGRRWIVTSEWDLFNLTHVQQNSPPGTWFFPEKTIETLENGFHAYDDASYTPLFISDPVDFETPEFLPTPIGLQWWLVESSKKTARLYVPDTSLETRLTCAAPSCVGQPKDFCRNGGVCNNRTGLCECSGFFVGDRCDHERPCFSQQNPCGGKGLCDINTGTCTCFPPRYGKLCQRTHKCYEEEGACRNGGVCDMLSGDCICPDGQICGLETSCFEQDVPCFGEGECDWDTGICKCFPPRYGDLCEKSYKCYEEGGACKNGGVCNNTTGECDCPSDPAIFPGDSACAKSLNCRGAGMACDNGGYCAYNGKCVCKPPYEGTLCNLVNKSKTEFFCDGDEDCMNGVCNLDTGICECSDPARYGTLCEHLHDCSNNLGNCLNDGICNETSGICHCPEPYFGPDCSQVPPCRSNSDCNGDDDDDLLSSNRCDKESGQCFCRHGYAAGKRCEKVPRCTSDHSCTYHKATCTLDGNCVCPSGFSGVLCEYLVSGIYPSDWDADYEDREQDLKVCGAASWNFLSGICGIGSQNCGTRSLDQQDYRGTINVTQDGFACEPWEGASENYVPADYPGKGLDGNYCRNPDEDDKAWCFAPDAPNGWGYCSVPYCDLDGEDGFPILSNAEQATLDGGNALPVTNYTTEIIIFDADNDF